jgi:DNA helicase II / ATP-dependent DNA helicase PcrA
MTRPAILLEDVLDALMLEEPEPSYEALTRWSERYPEYREALADFFAAWAVQAEMPQEITVDEDRLASLAVSHALDIVHRREEAARHTPTVADPGLRLIAAARAAGISEEELARRVGLDDTIIAKLDLRRIVDIPRLCFERLATVLSTAVGRIRPMVTGAALPAAGVRYKAKRTPMPVTEDFITAVRASSLSEETQRFWLEAVAAERTGSARGKNAWSEVRRQAQLRHVDLAMSAEDLVPTADLLAAAEASTGIKRQPRPPGDALLDGAEAAYNRERQRIYFSNATEPRLAAFHVAHEYAHHWMDEILTKCQGRDLDLATPAEPEMSLVGESDAYSPKERAEAQANLFAREFLLPRDKLRRLCRREIFDAARIANHVGVPVDLVMQQLADALLLPEERNETEKIQEERPLDGTQRQAIEGSPGPRRVRAGPGTGKTRTLIGKVKHLIDANEDPKSILVLTFSNLSAQDLAMRIQVAVGARATAIWASTFHAYGLELLRKYSVELGFSAEPRLLDRTASLMLLEELLPDLGLEHYLDLVDPMLRLRSILALIARAKDELATPARYEELARAMIASGDANVREEGTKALEVAHAYEIYERTLRERNLVDFGDLIARPVEFLRARPDIRDAIRDERRHVLVDEYQDVNRASGLLLRELVEPGRGPWVVGDVRQSIYRFRGASPVNLARFAQDFPGETTTDLGVNYRSGGRIVRTFEAFGVDMVSGDLVPPDSLEPHRGETAGRVDFEVASTFEAECEGISRTIRSDVEHSGRFGDHAILARSHTTLARLARHLERSGVPCLYFGDFFERPEIRDLLSLLSLVAERAGIGFFRAAQLQQYAVPPADIAAVFRWRREQDIAMQVALRRHNEIPDISERGRAALRRLADDIAAVDFPMSAHSFLLQHLFRRGDHLQVLLADDSVAGQQRRLAIYQLLQFAFSFRASPTINPKRAFLEHVRRLEILDEEKQLRQLPAAASDIDAIRMMTVHASKGLQFPLVHIPSVTSRHFPVNRQDPNPPPPGLIDADVLMSREAEEESLFFVAMSRAQDALHISRAIWYGGGSWSNVKPSPYLDRIRAHLPKRPDAPPGWTDQGAIEPSGPTLEPPEARDSWPARAIETYLDCPRRFYYAEVLRLGGGETATPYLKFQSALHASIGWLRETPSGEERQAGAPIRLAENWEKIGPKGHPFESIYRAAAEKMLATAVNLMEGESLPAELLLTIGGGVVVTCRADHIGVEADGIVVRRFKASRLADRETPKARYAIMQAAVRRQNAGASVHFEHVSLQTGERRRTTIDSRKLPAEIAQLNQAFANIAAGRFEPAPSDFKCPRCPYYFVCPSHGAVATP